MAQKTVIWIPGALESQLIYRPFTGGPRQTIWQEPANLGDVGLNAIRLKIPGESPFVDGQPPLEVGDLQNPQTVAGIKARVLKGGWAFEVWPYDWRLSIRTNAGKLAAKVLSMDAPEVALIGYSMGGVIAWAAWATIQPALATSTVPVRNLLTIGSPIGGAWSVVAALTGLAAKQQLAQWTLSISQWLFSRGSEKEIKLRVYQKVVSTWPGLAGLMPDPAWPDVSAASNGRELYFVANWEKQNPHITQALLDSAAADHVAIRAGLAVPRPQFTLSGYGINTVTDNGWNYNTFMSGGQNWEKATPAGDGITESKRAAVDTGNVLSLGVPHSTLVVDPRVADYIGTFLGAAASADEPPLPVPIKPPVSPIPTLPYVFPRNPRLPVTDP